MRHWGPELGAETVNSKDLQWLFQWSQASRKATMVEAVSRHRQAPSRRLAHPGTSRTLWYLCLSFPTHSPQPSTATGQPPRPRVLRGRGKAGMGQQ